MKKVLLCALIAVSFHGMAQTFDYSSNTGWNSYKNTYTVPPGCSHSTYTMPSAPNNVLEIDATNQRVKFNKVGGSQENRISKSLGVIYNNSFKADFEFNVSDDGTTNHGIGILPLVMTSQNLNPEMAVPMVGCKTAPNMDAISFLVYSGTETNTANLAGMIRVWDDGTVVSGNTATIPLTYGTTYYARILVFNNEKGQLIIYSNSARTTEVGKICINVPSTVNQLQYLQHAASTLSGVHRVTSAWVDNTSISTINPQSICPITITGPTNICSSNSGVFTVSNAGTNLVVTSSLNSGVAITPDANGNYVISDWGKMKMGAVKVVTITATSDCLCGQVTATYTVYIHPSFVSTFNFTGLSTSGTSISDFACVADFIGTSVTHEWQMYTGTSGAIGSSVRGPFTGVGSAGSTWNVTSATPSPALVTTTPYIVRHKITDPNNVCPTQESFSGINFTGQLGQLDDAGQITEMTPEQFNALQQEAGIRMKTENTGMVSIQPNPTDGKVTVKASANIVQVVVMDANGRELTKVAGNGNELLVDLSAMNKGTYLFKITTANGNYTERVVRQ